MSGNNEPIGPATEGTPQVNNDNITGTATEVPQQQIQNQQTEITMSQSSPANKKINRVMHDLIWPAAAGNVAWSFIDTTLKFLNNCSYSGLFKALSVLLLAMYLLLNFLESSSDKVYKWAVIDVLHAFSVIVVAIGIAQDPAPFYLMWLVAGMFLIAALGHFSGVWLPDGVTKSKKWAIGGIHLGAFILCVLLYKCCQNLVANYSYVCIAIAADLFVWKIFRPRIYYGVWIKK